MKRRTFIGLGIGAGVGTAVGAYAINFKHAVKQMLLDDTSQLIIDKSIIDRFIEDGEREKYWVKLGSTKKILISGQQFFYHFGIKLPYHEKYIQYRNMITGHFMLSTDFFINKMDTTKPVTYMAFFNPYKSPCSNPFSNLHFSS